MLRLVLIASLSLLVNIYAFSQLSKYYTVSNSERFDTVDFHLKASATNCLLNYSKEELPLVIYGNKSLKNINPSFVSKIINGTSKSSLILDEHNAKSFGDSFAYAVSRSDKENDFWKINYSDDKIYRLNLNYGIGNADVNLTGTSVQRLKIKSGSADIIVGYDNENMNAIEMDTFYIKTDFGSIVAKKMHATRAKYVITKVGFGNALLDFNEYLMNDCRVDAHVGAGNLEIVLPEESIPVIIYVKDSPLCAVKIADDFEEVENNVFVNRYYNTNSDNILSFNVDVALGMVKFKYVQD